MVPGRRSPAERPLRCCWRGRWKSSSSSRYESMTWPGRTRSCGRRTRSWPGPARSCGSWPGDRPLSWPRRTPRSRCCSGSCSGGRRRSPALSRTVTVTVMMPAPVMAGSRAAGRRSRSNAVRGRVRVGGIIRGCRGSRCSGISRAAGTAARTAGSRSRCWVITGPGSSWTGRSSSGWSRTAGAAISESAAARGQQTVMAPGPPKAVGKGLFTNGFIAMLLTERFGSGRSMNSLVTGLARQGAEISPATLAGDGRAGRGAAGPAGGARSRSGTRDSWLICTRTRRHGGCSPRGDGGGPAKFWLWVFIGADTVCFVMDPSRAGTVLARHAGIDEDTGQLLRGRGRGTAAAGDLHRFLRRVPVRRAEGRRAGQPVLLVASSSLLRPGGRREPCSAAPLVRCVAGTDPGPLRCP